jgi:hypothetical protein
VASQLTKNLKPYEDLSNHIARHLKAIAFISLSYLEIYEKPEGSLKSEKSDISHDSVEVSETYGPIKNEEPPEDSSLSTMQVLEEPGYPAPPQIPEDKGPDWPDWMTHRTTYPENMDDPTLKKFAAGAAKHAEKSHRVGTKVATESANEGYLLMHWDTEIFIRIKEEQRTLPNTYPLAPHRLTHNQARDITLKIIQHKVNETVSEKLLAARRAHKKRRPPCSPSKRKRGSGMDPITS